MVDKNLFLHDLALVAILKNEGRYLKEWLDYHLLAGVEHFYLYDNGSTDNQLEIAAPYIEAGLVDCFNLPGQAMQMKAYNDAVKKFKFQCRYMTFIDGDEFIYPKSTEGSVIEVVDEIYSSVPDVGELAMSWQIFGSNGEDKADYSRGVLERFTRRAVNSTNPHVYCKIVINPRAVNFIDSPHCMCSFGGTAKVDERGERKKQQWTIEPPLNEKLVVNHYHTKSREEYAEKVSRGSAARMENHKSMENFKSFDLNEEFDDGILKYRATRARLYRPLDRSRTNERLLTALMKNLLPTLNPTTPQEFYTGKMETFLTCREVATYLKTRLFDEDPARFLEEAALTAVARSALKMDLLDARLLIRELPKLLDLPYPAVKDIRRLVIDVIPEVMKFMLRYHRWKNFIELDRIMKLLIIKR